MGNLNLKSIFQKDYCFCPVHKGLYQKNHLKAIDGAIMLTGNKAYRTSVCDKCRKRVQRKK